MTTVTVAELIQELQRLPPFAPVRVARMEYDGYSRKNVERRIDIVDIRFHGDCVALETKS